MNRRQAIAASCAALIPGALLKEIPAEPKPLCFVMTLPDEYKHNHEQLARIQAMWEKRWQGEEVPKLVVLPHGVELKAEVA